jgi:ATP-dependent protease HslVU (ClpYQ) peptidase subunit
VTGTEAEELMRWFELGSDESKYPEFQKKDDEFVGMMVITPDKRVLKYERSPIPMEYPEEKWYAIGSGRDFAYGALHMGADAVKAVEATIAYSSSCGLGIDTLTLEE